MTIEHYQTGNNYPEMYVRRWYVIQVYHHKRRIYSVYVPSSISRLTTSGQFLMSSVRIAFSPLFNAANTSHREMKVL